MILRKNFRSIELFVPPQAVQQLNGMQLAPVRTAGGGTNDQLTSGGLVATAFQKAYNDVNSNNIQSRPAFSRLRLVTGYKFTFYIQCQISDYIYN